MLITCLFTAICNAQQDAAVKLPNLGITGELTYIKYTAENHAIRVFNARYLPDEVKSEMITRYNNLRVGTDQLTLQLISDMLRKKKLFYYKELDKYFLEGKKSKNKHVVFFIENYTQVSMLYDQVMAYPGQVIIDSLVAEYNDRNVEDITFDETETSPTQGTKLNPLDPLGSAGSLFTVYQNIKSNNLRKTSNIVEILKTLRLRDAAELVADFEEMEESKEVPVKVE